MNNLFMYMFKLSNVYNINDQFSYILSLEFQSHPVNEKQIYNLSSLPGQNLELYSPFFPSGYGQGVTSETLVTSSIGFIKITVVYVSLSESTSKDMINDVSCMLLDRLWTTTSEHIN